jgi:acetyl-CoA C-acetyltransferase
MIACASWKGHEAIGEEFPFPSLFAEVATEYDRRWGIDHQHLGRIVEVNLENAKANPNAQTRHWSIGAASFGTDDDLNPTVTGILRKFDCARLTDGAAGVVLCSASFADRWAATRGVQRRSVPVISGWGHATAPLSLEAKMRANAGSEYVFPHLRRAFLDACRRAGIEDVFGVDALEIHDCMTLSEYVVIDHVGLTSPGESWKAIEDGTIERSGAVPINPSGGLLGGGHPVGATGIRMLLDATRQVTERAGDYQVDGAKHAATLNFGGSFSTVVSLVVSATSAT